MVKKLSNYNKINGLTLKKTFAHWLKKCKGNISKQKMLNDKRIKFRETPYE